MRNSLLGISSLFCFSLLLFRMTFLESFMFVFLLWNLFLAAVPYFVSNILHNSRSKWASFGLFGIWLLFFPNAPYILTDLFHLKHRQMGEIWFDLVMILSFAWTGLMFGFYSFLDVERRLEVELGAIPGKIIMSGSLFLAGFGIYLGRFLRWNSWDILQHPFQLGQDILQRFVHPFSHERTWGMTILFGILLNLMVWFIKSVSEENQKTSVA